MPIKHLLQGLSPCFVCQQPNTESLVCGACLELLKVTPSSRCLRCALPLAQAGICGKCQTKPPSFDHSLCLSDYQWPQEHLLKQYKYAKQKHLASLLAESFIQAHPSPELPEAFCFVPMHWYKQWRRGFNQSEELAKLLSEHYQRPLLDLFKRRRLGASQASLSAKQREKALRHCFTLKQTITAKHLVIVDDVLTTGSTARVLAKLLKQAGATRVDMWFICRTP